MSRQVWRVALVLGTFALCISTGVGEAATHLTSGLLNVDTGETVSCNAVHTSSKLIDLEVRIIVVDPGVSSTSSGQTCLGLASESLCTHSVTAGTLGDGSRAYCDVVVLKGPAKFVRGTMRNPTQGERSDVR